MNFRCEVNDDDIASFVRHYVQHSPVARKQVRNARLYPSMAALLFFAFIGMLNRDWHAVGVGVFIFVFLMVILKRFVMRSMIKNSLRLMKAGKGMLGEHEFELANVLYFSMGSA